jgi:hypothetical protein
MDMARRTGFANAAVRTPAFRAEDTGPAGDARVVPSENASAFFRFSSSAKTILFAWVNDDKTLRTYGSRTDADRIFKKMLDAGNPPDDWDALAAAAKGPELTTRLATSIKRGKEL